MTTRLHILHDAPQSAIDGTQCELQMSGKQNKWRNGLKICSRWTWMPDGNKCWHLKDQVNRWKHHSGNRDVNSILHTILTGNRKHSQLLFHDNFDKSALNYCTIISSHELPTSEIDDSEKCFSKCPRQYCKHIPTCNLPSKFNCLPQQTPIKRTSCYMWITMMHCLLAFIVRNVSSCWRCCSLDSAHVKRMLQWPVKLYVWPLTVCRKEQYSVDIPSVRQHSYCAQRS